MKKLVFKSVLLQLFKYILNGWKTFGKNISTEKDLTIKRSSRIKSWGKDGTIKIFSNVSLGYNSELYVWNGTLQIGKNTSINDNCKIYENVRIGDNCLLASNIFISSGSHCVRGDATLPIKLQDEFHSIDRPIIIEDDCWIGFGVVIMPGVYVGKGAVIGANSVVTKNVFPYTINAGVPSKMISTRFEFEGAPSEINSFDKLHWPFFYRGANYNQFSKFHDLIEGLEMLATSVILLKKINIKTLYISGFCYSNTVFNISVDGYGIFEVTKNAGDFYLHHEFDTSDSISSLTEFPDEIKALYSLIQVNAQSSSKSNKPLWKVKSVKIS